MTLIEHTGIFVLSTILVLISWLIYLLVNEYIDKLKAGLLQEVLGVVTSFGLFMLIGVILYYFSYSFFMGWFLVIIALLIYRGMNALFRHFSREPGKSKAGNGKAKAV